MEIMDDESMNLGTCCICETSEGVRNIIMLDKKAPITGRGWGCFVCHLPSDGASAVLCDECLEGMNNQNIELKFACRGYPGSDGRINFDELKDEHKHDMSFHPEQFVQCKNCEATAERTDQECPECHERICPGCGCTDSAACGPDGCYWLPSGICSTCDDQLETEDFLKLQDAKKILEL